MAKKIKIKIVYDNFINKYTKKRYPFNEIVEVTEKRLGEIKDLEKETGKKLFELVDDTPSAEDIDKNIDNNEDGDNIDENGDNDNADNEDGEENKDDAE